MHLLAYLDAGSGSVILQAIVAGVAGGGVVARLYWSRVKRFFARAGRQETAGSQTIADSHGEH